MHNLKFVAAAGVGDELMTHRVSDGAFVFVSYLLPTILMTLRPGSVVKFKPTPYCRVGNGMQKCRIPDAIFLVEDPSEKAEIKRHFDFFRIEHPKEGEIRRIFEFSAKLDDLGLSERFTIMELSTPERIPDITFDVAAQLERDGIEA